MDKTEKRPTQQENGDVDKRVKLVRDRKAASKDMRGDREATWNKAYQYYLGEKTNDEDKFFVPETNSIVETILTRVAGPYRNKGKSPVNLQARLPEHQNNAEFAEAIANYGAIRDNVSKKLEYAFRQALIYGFTVGKCFWKTHKTTRTVQQPIIMPHPFTGMPMQMGMQDVEEEYFDIDDPSLEIVSVYDFFPDPAALSVDAEESMRWCIESRIYSKEELIEAAEGGFFTPSLLKKMLDQVEEGEAEEDDAKQVDMDLKPARTQDSGRDVETKFRVDIMWTKERIVAAADDKYLLTDRVNDYGFIPFVVTTCYDLLFQLYGMGVPELIMDQQDYLNRLANLTMRNIDVATNNMFFARSDMGIENQDLKTRPNGIIWVKAGREASLNDIIAPVPFQDIKQTAFMIRDWTEQKMANVTAATEYVRATSTDIGPKQTATEVQAKTQQASSRFEFLFNHMGEFVVGIYKMFLKLYQKFMSEEKIVKILGKMGATNYMRVNPQQIQGDFEFNFILDPMRANDQSRAQQTMQFVGMMQGSPMFAPYINVGESVQEIADQLEIDPDIIKSEEQVQFELQQQQQQAMAQAALQGGFPGSGPSPGMGGGSGPMAPGAGGPGGGGMPALPLG